jgi:hypothetical protein
MSKQRNFPVIKKWKSRRNISLENKKNKTVKYTCPGNFLSINKINRY